MAGKKSRGFFSSFQYVTLISGQLIALCVLLVLQSLLPARDLESWGWRIPFAIGGVLAIAVFYIRRGLSETQSYTNAQTSAAPKSSGWILFRKHPREAFLVMALTAGGTLAFYAYSTYMQKFLVNTSGFQPRGGHRDHRGGAVHLHAAAAGGRGPVGSDRPQAVDDRVRDRRGGFTWLIFRPWRTSPHRSPPSCWCWAPW